MIMDLLVKRGLNYTQRRKNYALVLLGALGVSGYGMYRVYHLPSMVSRRKRLMNLLGALVSIAEMVSDSAKAIGVVSRDLKEFIQSDSNEIPKSLRQLSKITRSEEFSESMVGATTALTKGIVRGYSSGVRNDEMKANSSFPDQVRDKLFTAAGSGFASAVVGSFARNLIMAFYSERHSSTNDPPSAHPNVLGSDSVSRWIHVACNDKCKELIGDCIQKFVSTAVAVYLDKTMDINTYDEIFSGLTNPEHESKMREILAAICNGAVQTLVKTSHQVMTNTNSNASSSSSSLAAIDQFHSPNSVDEQLELERPSTEPEARKSFDGSEDGGWVGKMSSTLATTNNKKFVLDITGRVTFETIRSFLQFLLEKLYVGLTRSFHGLYEAVVDRGLEVAHYVTAKSSVIATLCLSLYLHILGVAWVLVPA